MPYDHVERPFESIESAYEFMNVLDEIIQDAVRDLRQDHATALLEGQSRKAQAIDLALCKTRTLNGHVRRSRLILNDLRSVRRLILSERTLPELMGAGAE